MEKLFWMKFEKALESDFLCDYSLQVENQVLRVHKVILASRSGYFYSLFRWNLPHESHTQLHEISKESLNLILKFLYNNHLETLILEDIFEVLRMGQFFQVPSLIHQCEQHIIRMDISTMNVCFIWNAAKELRAEHVCEICKAFLIENFTLCCTQPGFLQLHKDSLKLALTPGQINTHEFVIFEALKKWF